VYEALREAVEQLDDPSVPNDLVEVLALIDRLDAHVAQSLGRLDRDGAFELDGQTSVSAWLVHHAGRTRGQADKLAATARKIVQLPATGAAWRNGSLSGGQVEAILTNVKSKHVPLFAGAESELVPQFVPLTVGETAMAMRWWAKLADDADPDRDPDDAADKLHLSETLDGRRVLSGQFSGESGASIEQALRLAVDDDHQVPLSQRNATALRNIAEFFLNHHDKKGSRRNRPHVTVVMRDDGEGEPAGQTMGGVPFTRTSLKQILCDCTISRLVMARGEILDYGVPTPTIPLHLWQCVAARDGGCRFPGCDRPIAWCECHHVMWRDHGGPTAATNLAMFCSFHHHLLHKPGWSAKLLPDATLEVTDPEGRVSTSYPPDQRRTLWPPGDGDSS
jgi:hypothetical protein